MSKDYGSWSIANLKAELQKRKAKVTGKKAVLVQRLQDYDTIFGNIVNDPETSYIIDVPDPRLFCDIHSDTLMPNLNKDDLDVFCIVAERDDLSTAKRMYDEKFLISARAANVHTDFFIIASCASEMRKRIAYNVTIKYQDNTIIESQCECAAGMGPYAQCKHVITVLYGLIDFSSNKIIQIRKTCTEMLQSFHRPTKFYTGEPVETENLCLKVKNKNLSDITNYDPRSSQVSSEKYKINFKKQVANFCVTLKDTMPMAELNKPADKWAAYNDHDYLDKTQEEKYLESLILNKENLKNLQINTKNDKKLWKNQRLLRLQSSNFGQICKCKDNGKQKLAKSLLKDSSVMTAAMKYGIKYERQAIQKFSSKMELSVTKCGIIINEDLQFLASTPDGLIGEDGILEVKCPFSATKQIITPESVPYLYLCEETGYLQLDKTHNYYYQVQGQLFCTKRKYAYFCIYTIKDLCIVKIQRNEKFIESMVKTLSEFYNDYYKKNFLNRYLYNKKI